MLEEVGFVLSNAWNRQTSFDPQKWSYQNRAWGQCAVTALVIQDIVGGSLLRGMTPQGSHYWNVVDGVEIDLTKKQFPEGTEISDKRKVSRRHMMENTSTAERYQLLWERMNWHRMHRRVESGE